MLPFPTCNTKSNMTLKLSMIKFYQNDYIKCSFSNITTEILTVHTNFTKKTSKSIITIVALKIF